MLVLQVRVPPVHEFPVHFPSLSTFFFFLIMLFENDAEWIELDHIILALSNRCFLGFFFFFTIVSIFVLVYLVSDSIYKLS